MTISFKIVGIWIGILFCFSVCPAVAQQIKVVSGRVLNQETKKPFDKEAVFVYAFNTVAAAEDVKKKIDDNEAFGLSTDAMEVVGNDGYYEIRVAENGALIFKIGLAPCVLEKVNYRMEINAVLDAGIVLEDVSIVGTLQDIKPAPKAPTIIGNKLLLYGTFPIPAQFGKPNARLIIQPYVVDCETNDTVTYTRPLIYDGPEFGLTQERRMNFCPANDPLYAFVAPKPLTEDRMSLEWTDTVPIPDPTRNYHGTAAILLEDYTHVYYDKQVLVNTCETKRPLKFLEFSFNHQSLNPDDYRERPKREKRNTAGNISLSFLVGKAMLDPDDPANAEQLDKLKSDLLEIVNGEGTTLKEFHITGISSPEGSYASNLALARQRVNFAHSQVTSVLPARVLSRVYQNPQAKVATWEAVADLLEKDTFPEAAAAVREIINRFPKSQDAQYSQILRLPYYTTTIKDIFPKLRTVHYEYKHELYRELTPEEILDKYQHDEAYRSGKKSFALYEYWNLFKMIKDPHELEALYKRAYHESETMNGQPWILAANNLAVSYLARDTFDTSILEPFIDRKTRGVNVVRTRIDGVTKEIINPEAIVANQLAMYIRANNYEQASVMAQILPDTPQNEMMKAFAMCLGGYYRGGTTAEERMKSRKVFDLVKKSSPINGVVMDLAMESKGYDVLAEQEAAKLPADNPVCWYLKAIINNRKGEMGFEEAKNCLINCFKLDEKYIAISASDGDIGKDLYEYTMDMYSMSKEM